MFILDLIRPVVAEYLLNKKIATKTTTEIIPAKKIPSKDLKIKNNSEHIISIIRKPMYPSFLSNATLLKFFILNSCRISIVYAESGVDVKGF